MTLVRGDVEANTGAERFFGGLLKAPVSRRASIELSIDRRTETNDALTERTVDTPLQATLLLYPVHGRIAPYLLGGVGWYRKRVEQLTAGTVTTSDTTRRFGYHAGIGGELRPGRRIGVHADYRYTFLKFSGDDEEESIIDRLKPSYEGSMWTVGLTLYF